ncbi:MAG: efflux RND transporter permease subunit [Myxococcales bacterium]|nr:efflux RND transporter permease subunit [Myxococcales bacterium]
MSSSGKWEQALPRFSLNRRIAVTVLMLSALVVGAVATLGIPLELVPRGYQAPQLVVRAAWRDSPPPEVLDKIVLPLEEELSTVRGLDQLNSLSRTGSAELFLSFKQGTNMDVAYREVRDRILQAQPRLPSDLLPVRIRKESSSNLPIMAVGVAIDPKVGDPYNLIQREIVQPLRRVEGVASVASPGLQEKEVLIELDRERTEAAGLNIYLVGLQLQADNFSMASGNIRHGGDKLLLRSVSRFADIEEIRNQFVAPNLRLHNIAKVRLQEPEKRWIVRVNSKPALALQIFKEGQANTIEVSKRLKEAFREIQNNPKLHGSDTGVLFSQGDVISESISTLLDSGKVGALLAALALLFFLRRFRLTLIITLSIPLSLILSLTVIYFAGETLNILSLLGLIISVGLLVDNSVVVAENILRIYADGASRREASIHGAAEIALAIILATLTTIIVFLPVALVEGKGQFFLLRLAIPITVSLAASLVVALIFVPLCVYLTLGSRDTGDEPPSRVQVLTERVHHLMDAVFGFLYHHTLDRLGRFYRRLLAVALRRRLDTVLILLVVFAATMMGPGAGLKIVEISEEDQQGFSIGVELPRNFTLGEASEFFDIIEAELAEAKEKLDMEGYFTFHVASYGELQGWFERGAKTSKSEAAAYVLERLPKRPGVKYFSGTEERGKESENRLEHRVLLTGESSDTLEEASKKLEAEIQMLPGVTGIKRTMDLTPNELALLVNRDKSSRQGVNPEHIAGVVAAGLRGQSLPRFQQDGNEIPVRLRFDRDSADSLAELADFSVPSADGQMRKLSALTEFRYLSSARGIFRQDKRVSRRITIDLAPDADSATRASIDEVVATANLPEGVRWRRGEDAGLRQDDEVASMKFAAMVSVLFIYLLMGFLFESFILPLSIIFTIPAAAIGVVWAHGVAGRELDFLGFVGVILLIGVVVNNGIVFVDYVRRLRQGGEERSRAILLAAEHRFRPIMMTATTTIGGMIPLTLGEPSSIGISYRSFGLTLMGGMATATALTLLVVPIFYTLLDDASTKAMALARSALSPLQDRVDVPCVQSEQEEDAV